MMRRFQYDDNYVCSGIESEFVKYGTVKEYELEEIISRYLNGK